MSVGGYWNAPEKLKCFDSDLPDIKGELRFAMSLDSNTVKVLLLANSSLLLNGEILDSI